MHIAPRMSDGVTEEDDTLAGRERSTVAPNQFVTPGCTSRIAGNICNKSQPAIAISHRNPAAATAGRIKRPYAPIVLRNRKRNLRLPVTHHPLHPTPRKLHGKPVIIEFSPFILKVGEMRDQDTSRLGKWQTVKR